MKISPEKEMQIRIEIAANHARANPDKIEVLCERLGVSHGPLYRIAEEMGIRLVKPTPKSGKIKPWRSRGGERRYCIGENLASLARLNGELDYSIDNGTLTLRRAQ